MLPAEPALYRLSPDAVLSLLTGSNRIMDNSTSTYELPKSVAMMPELLLKTTQDPVRQVRGLARVPERHHRFLDSDGG